MHHAPAVIDIESQVIDPREDTYEEADARANRIVEYFKPAEKNLLAIRAEMVLVHERKSWKALGLDSFKDFCEIRLERLCNSTVWNQLLLHTFEMETPALAGIPGSHAVQLMSLDAPEERMDAVEIARAKAAEEGRPKPTAKHVRSAVLAIQAAKIEIEAANADTSTENAGPKPQKTGRPRGKREPTDEERDRRAVALASLKKVLSRTTIKAIEDEVVHLSLPDLEYWAGMTDPDSIENLVTGSREMRPRAAHEWSQRMVTDRSTAADLINRSLMLGHGLFEATVDGALIVVATTPGLKKSLAAWVKSNTPKP